MTPLCIIFAVHLGTVVFSMTKKNAKLELDRLLEKDGSLSLRNLSSSEMSLTMQTAVVVLFILI